MLEIQNISKLYKHKEHWIEAIKNVSLSIKEGEFVAFVGPSGCGKTTLLKIIAGLIEPSSGNIVLDNKNIDAPQKDLGVVFQGFTLFPWLNVEQNIAFGLDLQGLKEEQKFKIVDHYLKVTGLKDFAEFYPKDLSGGMQQRVAIARTLANNPKVLLMDEPFGALDSQTRSQMQQFLTSLWETEHKTVIFITHDVSEAVFLADTVYVLSNRPMEIKKVFKVPFLRPRTHELKQTKEFFDFTNQVAQELES